MIRLPHSFMALLAGCLMTCTKDSPTADCQPATMLTAQAPCESGYPGVLLRASGQQVGSQIQFVYEIYPQPDTLSNTLSPKSRWSNASDDRILVPESVITDAPKFTARVSVNCSGKELYSRYFAFVKRPIGKSLCYVWALQN